MKGCLNGGYRTQINFPTNSSWYAETRYNSVSSHYPSPSEWKGTLWWRPRRIPLLTQRHKKARLEYAKTYVTKPQSFWENVLWTDETEAELLEKDIMALFTEREMRQSKKRTQFLQSNMVEVHRCLGVALLLLALDASTVWMVSWNLIITKTIWGTK